MSTNSPTTNVEITAGGVERLLGKFVASALFRNVKSSGILSVNSQARRLGCITYLVGIVSSGRKVRSLLMSPSSAEVAELTRNLQEHGFTTGFLTAAPSSFRHYADAALKLNLLIQQGEVFELTPRGRFLAAAIKPDWRRPYPLASETKVFFLHLILAADYLGTAAILRSLLQDRVTSNDLKREHPSRLESMLQEVVQTSSDIPLQRMASDRLLSLREWKNPASYCEHLVSAKLNWLVDLGIVQLPSSPTIPLSVTEQHRPWLNRWSATVAPNDVQLISLLLSYAQIVAPATAPAFSGTLPSALETAFARLVPASGLSKLRLSDFVLFLVCFQPRVVLQWIADGQPLFPESRFACGDVTYAVQSAARFTQAYVLREETPRP